MAKHGNRVALRGAEQRLRDHLSKAGSPWLVDTHDGFDREGRRPVLLLDANVGGLAEAQAFVDSRDGHREGFRMLAADYMGG